MRHGQARSGEKMKIEYSQAKQLIENENAQFIDVRTPEEYADSGIPCSVNLPLQEIERLDFNLLDADKERPIVLFCRTGRRSDIALNILHHHGYTKIFDMGSYKDWQG